MKIALLQLPYIGMSSTKLFRYVRQAHNQGVELLVLGEYVLTPFFKELQELSTSMIKKLAEHQLRVLKELSKSYKMVIVAPLVMVKKSKPYKMVAKITPSSTAYYQQNFLINYPHWNEQKFFANELQAVAEPLIFKIHNFRYAIMSGFELHFDTMFEAIDEKKVEALIVPSVSTFESHKRWKNLLKMRAFTHNTYMLRVNRVGEFKEDKHSWRFYGKSLLVSPHGEVLSYLGESEELLIATLHKKEVREARKEWGFVPQSLEQKGLK